MLRVSTTLDRVIAFLCPDEAVPEVVLVSTARDLWGEDQRPLGREEWPLIAVAGLTGRVGEIVRITFNADHSALPLPSNDQPAAILLRWALPQPEAMHSRGGTGDHHHQRREKKAATNALQAAGRKNSKVSGKVSPSEADLALALAVAQGRKVGRKR